MRLRITLFSAVALLCANYTFARVANLCNKAQVASVKTISEPQDKPKSGLIKEFYPNGNLKREYTITNGKLEGAYKLYNEKGHLVSDQFHVNGRPYGYFRNYYDNGQLRTDATMKDGVMDGISKEYHENGKLKQDNNLTGKPGSFSGTMKSFNQDGLLQTVLTLTDGKVVLAIKYDQQGRLASEESEGRSVTYSYQNNGTREVSINGVKQK